MNIILSTDYWLGKNKPFWQHHHLLWSHDSLEISEITWAGKIVWSRIDKFNTITWESGTFRNHMTQKNCWVNSVQFALASRSYLTTNILPVAIQYTGTFPKQICCIYNPFISITHGFKHDYFLYRINAILLAPLAQPLPWQITWLTSATTRKSISTLFKFTIVIKLTHEGHVQTNKKISPSRVMREGPWT